MKSVYDRIPHRNQTKRKSNYSEISHKVLEYNVHFDQRGDYMDAGVRVTQEQLPRNLEHWFINLSLKIPRFSRNDKALNSYAPKKLVQLPKPIAEKIAIQIKSFANNLRPNCCKKTGWFGSVLGYALYGLFH
jgi:hypothetical protein